MTPNRKQRRAAKKATLIATKHLKYRCVVCERAGRKMNKEHYWPLWLIERTEADKEGVRWLTGEMVNPKSATIPVCKECNLVLGQELEGPVSRIFEALENGEGLTDIEAELLVRWLWKLEGLSWCMAFPQLQYSDRWTVRERVLGDAIFTIRDWLVLGISLIEKNDEGYESRPVGLDSPLTQNSIFVSGVFSFVAMMVSFSTFSGMIPEEFSQYAFKKERGDPEEKVFFPGTNFVMCNDAINATREASIPLTMAHHEMAESVNENQKVIMRRPRVELL